MRKGAWKLHLKTTNPASVVTWGQWVIESHDPPLLFDVEVDPGETTDRVKDHPEIVSELVGLITRSVRTSPPARRNVSRWSFVVTWRIVVSQPMWVMSFARNRHCVVPRPRSQATRSVPVKLPGSSFSDPMGAWSRRHLRMQLPAACPSLDDRRLGPRRNNLWPLLECVLGAAWITMTFGKIVDRGHRGLARPGEESGWLRDRVRRPGGAGLPVGPRPGTSGDRARNRHSRRAGLWRNGKAGAGDLAATVELGRDHGMSSRASWVRTATTSCSRRSAGAAWASSTGPGRSALNRVVALKMILAGELAAPPTSRRFRAEAEAVAQPRPPAHRADLRGRRARRPAVLQHEADRGRQPGRPARPAHRPTREPRAG